MSSAAPKGFRPSKNPLVKQADQTLKNAVKEPVSKTDTLEPSVQKFSGKQTPPRESLVSVTQLSRAPPLPASKLPAAAAPSLPRAPSPTPDIKKLTREISPALQRSMRLAMPPLFKQYYKGQEEIETENPYLTDTTVYMPQTRKAFYKFITDSYKTSFYLGARFKEEKVDEDACAKLAEAGKDKVEAFLYQKFVREYIRQAAPNRGILVYHGLGSGKTCSSIAAAEALYGNSNKKIIVMTPFSLRANFMSEISFCGFRHFSLKNHWVAQPITQASYSIYRAYANSVMSLSDAYLTKLMRREDEARRVLWIIDFSKPSNYDELTAQQRDDIRAQINEAIENRITFINYNGIQASKLKEYACNADPVTGERMFDNAVIIIDEIHNLTRLMQGTIIPYMVKRGTRARRIEAEPVTPGKWKPKLCTKNDNYKRAFLFYRLLTDARNSKIIGLSGTPLINFPEELAILANVLSGYTECVEVPVLSRDEAVITKFIDMANADPRVDMIHKRIGKDLTTLMISVFNEGYEKAKEEDTLETDFIGVKYNPDAQETIQEVFTRLKDKAKAEGISLGTEKYVSYPRLPPDGDEFRPTFISGTDIKNELVLKKRLTGLISYYKGSKDDYMPRVVKDEVVKCEMSDYTFSKYTTERVRELKGEMRKQGKEGGDAFADVEMFAKMKNPSSYRFRSRAICNFSFPSAIERPFPDSPLEEEEEVTQVEDLEMAEAQTNPDMDLQAQKLVDDEEEMIEEPEEGEEGGEEEKEMAEGEERAVALEQQGGEGSDDEGEEEEEEDDELHNSNLESQASSEASNTSTNSNTSSEASNASTNSNTSSEASNTSSEASTNNEDDEDELIRQLEEYEAEQAASAAPPPPPPKLKKRPVLAPPKPAAPANTASEAEAVYEAEQAAPKTQQLTYQDRVRNAMRKLDTLRSKYLQLNPVPTEKGENAPLAVCSSKLDAMIRRINVSQGSNLVYSQFKTVEGLGVLGVALKANGYSEIVIEGSDLDPHFSAETEASFAERPDEKRYILFTGEGSRERRGLIINLFNGNYDKLPEKMRSVLVENYADGNKYGKLCWVIGITGAGAEGISLKCCRSVHIMEPYWNNVRLDQVKGRAIRICSHADLPYKDREVEIYTYYTVFSKKQIDEGTRDDAKFSNMFSNDEYQTSDEKVYNVSKRKEIITGKLLQIMKEVAVDCELNSRDNELGLSCFELEGKPTQYVFHPDLQTDIIETGIEMRQDKQKMTDVTDTKTAVDTETRMPVAPPRAQTIELPVIKWGGIEYMLSPKDKAGGLVFNLYLVTDNRLRNPVGEIARNPVTDKFEKPIIY